MTPPPLLQTSYVQRLPQEHTFVRILGSIQVEPKNTGNRAEGNIRRTLLHHREMRDTGVAARFNSNAIDSGPRTDHSKSDHWGKVPFEQHHRLDHQNVMRFSLLDRRS